jgi:hypothetical protein
MRYRRLASRSASISKINNHAKTLGSDVPKHKIPKGNYVSCECAISSYLPQNSSRSSRLRYSAKYIAKHDQAIREISANKPHTNKQQITTWPQLIHNGFSTACFSIIPAKVVPHDHLCLPSIK